MYINIYPVHMYIYIMYKCVYITQEEEELLGLPYNM